ncbi:hypothetical protein FRC06_001637 [Ceratobasidium sp. 370]|nr:hypothetical protein FRC06_001637 [Ceratobasidium sp. 370]
MAPRKKTSKRALESPGDISISLTPAAPKKPKAQKGTTATGTASKQTTSDAENHEDDQPELAAIPSPPAEAKEPEEGCSPTSSTTKTRTAKAALASAEEALEPTNIPTLPVPKAKKSKLAAKAGEDSAPQLDAGVTSTKLPGPMVEAKKSEQNKKPSDVADKVKKQEAAKQNAKEAKEAKKAKKVEAAVIVETPEETAAFLAQAKGQSQLPKISPTVASPKRKKLMVDRAKAMEQLVSSHTPSPNPSVISGTSAGSGTSGLTGSIAPDDSISQVSKSKPKNATPSSLQVPSSGPSSRGVSPTAPLLSIPPSSAASRDVSPSVESIVTADDFDEELTPRVDFTTLLKGIPCPWNVGPASPPPALPEPLHLAKLKPDILQLLASLKDKSKAKRASKEEKDKAKMATRPHVGNFREQDQMHLKLNLEFMDNLVTTVYAFPDEEACWNFALMSNYWASNKLGRSYCLERNSEHCRLLYSRISQSHGRFVSPSLSDRIRDNYSGLSWKPLAGVDEVQALAAVRQRVADMIKDSSFLAPDDWPTAYYQNAWFIRVLKLAYWSQASSKGFSDDHATHFGGISYPLLALVVTVTEKMLAVVAAGPVAANNRKKEPESKFSHSVYGPRFDSHLMTLARLHRSPAGPKLTSYLTQAYKELRGRIQNPTMRLAIPLSALNNYGSEPEPRAVVQSRSKAAITSSNTHASSTGANSATMGIILNDPALSADQKLQILSVIYSTTEVESHSHSRSARSARQYQGLWTEVTAGSDDSKVEAQHTGALLTPNDQANTANKLFTTDSDKEMTGGDGRGVGKSDSHDGSNVQLWGESKAEGESEAKVETEAEAEAESEAEGGSEAKGGSEAESEDLDVEAIGEEVKGECSGNNEARVDSSSDNDSGPAEPHKLQFFTVDGNMAGVYSSEHGGDSDGEGASGDQTMLTAAGSDDDDD